MAAFEAVSRVKVRPFHRQSLIDFRIARLPPGQRTEQDDFDPQLYREPKTPITLWMAYFNLLRTVFGAGVLGMPLAISKAGIILGPILGITTGCMILHTHLMLLRCLNEVSRRLKIPHISYRYGFRIAVLHGPELVHCLGHRGPTIIATCMILSQLGICTVFVCFTSDSLRDIMDWQTSKPAILALVVPFLVLEFYMKTLKIVSYVSLWGGLLNLAGLVLVLYRIFDHPRGEFIYVSTNLFSVLFSFTTFLFNLSAVGVVLSIDRALVNPKVLSQGCGILHVGILIPTVVTTIFGVLGYWSFGTMEENILRSLPYDDDISMAAIAMYSVSIALAYPIQCYPGILIILEVIKNYNLQHAPTDESMQLVETIARPTFVLTSFIICYFIPFQGPITAFVGNLCTTLLALVFPALMDISLMYPGPYGKWKIYLVKDLILIIFGLICWVFGVVFSVYKLYVNYTIANSPNDVDT